MGHTTYVHAAGEQRWDWFVTPRGWRIRWRARWAWYRARHGITVTTEPLTWRNAANTTTVPARVTATINAGNAAQSVDITDVTSSLGEPIVTGIPVNMVFTDADRIEFWSGRGERVAWADRTGFHWGTDPAVTAVFHAAPPPSGVGSLIQVVNSAGDVVLPRMDVPGVGGVPLPTPRV